MSTAKERREAWREREKARFDLYLNRMSEEERAALAERIFNAIHPKDDWHEPERDFAAEEQRAMDYESRYGLAADPRSWKP